MEFPVIVEEAKDHIVGDEQGSCADDPTQDTVVFADDGVLHRIRERQQDDQVKWIELDELALSGEPETDHQEGINDDRPKDLFRQGKSDDEHIFPNVVHNRIASSGRPHGFYQSWCVLVIRERGERNMRGSALKVERSGGGRPVCWYTHSFATLSYSLPYKGFRVSYD